MCGHNLERIEDDQADRGREMSPELVGVLGFAALFVFLAAGMPIGVGMGIVGAVGLCLTLSVPAAVTKMATAPFELVSNYTFASLPLFLLMGHAIFSSGQGGAMFKAAAKWFGRVPGGLAMATVAACALFGAVSASSVACAVTMGLVALPEMKKRNYDTALSMGVVAAGGTIGSLIPPSNYLLIYGILTENSIGKLFAGGVIPGIIVSASYIILIGVRCWRKPVLGPHAGRHSMKEKIVALGDIWEIIVLGIFSIGGLIIGIFTATEAGAVGAAGAFLSSAVRGKLTWKTFSQAVLDATTTTGMIYAILIGAFIFNYFCAASRLPTILAEWVAGMALPPAGIMAVIVIIYLILGCLMDAPSIQMLTTPIFYPLVMSLGFDPIWFGVLQCRLLEVGLITPPMGMNVYVVAGLDKSIPMTTVFRGILWFLLMDVVTLVIFMYWPSTITFLPSMMK
jgi:C4-dicarboxylate transporter, DctM subunit